MGFRFYRRIKVAPGVSINLGKKGASVSVGPRGAKMTFGPNGTRTSVGIPGTGMRYEKRYTNTATGEGGNAPWQLIVAAVLGAVAYFAYLFSRVEKSDVCIFLMVVCGIAAILMVAFWIISIITESSSAEIQTTYTRRSSQNPRFDTYVRELAAASQTFYSFLRELNRSTRCRNQLKALPSMECFDDNDSFTINSRLAAIVYCDVRDCFRRLGYDEGRLQGLTGIGYAMFVLLLIDKKFDLLRFLDVNQRGKLLEIVGKLKDTAKLEIDIADHESEFRFNVIFGVAHNEDEWVQRFATLLYRWASLIAKADGVVTSAESEALASIMKLVNNSTGSGGNVRVTGANAAPKADFNKGEIDLFADAPPDENENPRNARVADADLKDVKKAVECIIKTGRASTSLFQRHLGWGYNHAALVLDRLEELGVVSGQNGTGPRQIIMGQDQLVAFLNQDKVAAKKSVAEAPFNGGLKEVMRKLDSLIGLGQVKDEVRQLTNFIEIQCKRKERGLKVAPITYHCVFTGNPGTGKTTVARILADIFRELGVVKKGHLVETDRSGLVAEYVGQTAVKTNNVIDTALDGVLFVDEAYTLVQGGDRDYGGEAIATLLKRMEDDRGRLVVVLAGYTEEMKKFINSNPGLQSRFSRYIEFPDYTAQELAEIFLMNAEKNQYTCDKDVRASIVNVMEVAVRNKDVNFGNARYVRNLFEKAIQRQAVRLSTVAPITTEMLSELTLHDLGFAYED
ncbi:MAG: DUF4236 domain-containing protein [Kiritimatiellae bacterium]|nr:DUF4236 domain-containing protein [Kiritimatiellia bacterium]